MLATQVSNASNGVSLDIHWISGLPNWPLVLLNELFVNIFTLYIHINGNSDQNTYQSLAVLHKQWSFLQDQVHSSTPHYLCIDVCMCMYVYVCIDGITHATQHTVDDTDISSGYV